MQTSETLNEWVGLRPGRPNVRLEAEIGNDSNSVVNVNNFSIKKRTNVLKKEELS